MRNLKKFLALVLTLMMVVSLFVTASAAGVIQPTPGTDYNDDTYITGKYDEAVQVLTQLGIFRGKGTTATFKPGDDITRAEVAALVYRITSKDVNDKQYTIYEGYADRFTDVANYKWALGYIGYISNGEYVQGDGQGHFMPGKNISGYEVLAIILRAIGYDAWKEFQGDGWEIRVASTAQQLGILDALDNNDRDLRQNATREVVAQMLFTAIAKTSMVRYDLVKRYEDLNKTLAYQNFRLFGGNTGTSSAVAPAGSDPDTDYKSMTTRMPAEADTTYYGEPYAVWCVDDIDSDPFNPTGTETPDIIVRFNYNKEYVDGVTSHDLWTDGFSKGNAVTPTEDGDTGTPVTPTQNATNIVVADRGTIVDVYVVEGTTYIVIKNIYTDFVQAKWTATGGGAGKGGIQLAAGDPEYGGTPVDVDDADKLYTGDLAVGDVVIYTTYDGAGTKAPDVASIHAVNGINVTVTDSKKVTDATDSYFKVGSKTYEYNCNYDQSAKIVEKLVDRDGTPRYPGTSNKLVVYLDDNGYVVHTEEPGGASATTGYFLVTNAGNGYTELGDGGFVRTFTAYDMEGNRTTLKGAVNSDDGTNALWYYQSDKDAADYNHKIDIYYGVYTDGYWSLTNSDAKADTHTAEDHGVDLFTADKDLLAGNPEMVDTTYLVTDETVFLFATYGSNKVQTSTYKKVVGFKNVGTISEAFDGTAVDNNKFVAHWVSFQEIDATDTRAKQVAFVYIAGAELNEAVEYETIDITGSLLYLVDKAPEKNHDKYDTYDVIKGGALTTQRADKGLDGSGEVFDNSGSPDPENKFYTYKLKNGQLTSATAAYDLGQVDYVAPGILKLTTYSAPSSGSENEVDDIVRNGNTDNYLILANNCKIYAIDNGKVTLLTAADYENIVGTSTSDPDEIVAAQCVVAQSNDQGYVTVLYISST